MWVNKNGYSSYKHFALCRCKQRLWRPVRTTSADSAVKNIALWVSYSSCYRMAIYSACLARQVQMQNQNTREPIHLICLHCMLLLRRSAFSGRNAETVRSDVVVITEITAAMFNNAWSYIEDTSATQLHRRRKCCWLATVICYYWAIQIGSCVLKAYCACVLCGRRVQNSAGRENFASSAYEGVTCEVIV